MEDVLIIQIYASFLGNDRFNIDKSIEDILYILGTIKDSYLIVE